MKPRISEREREREKVRRFAPPPSAKLLSILKSALRPGLPACLPALPPLCRRHERFVSYDQRIHSKLTLGSDGLIAAAAAAVSILTIYI